MQHPSNCILNKQILNTMKNQTLSTILSVAYIITTLLIFSNLLCNSYSELIETANKEALMLTFCFTSIVYFALTYLLNKKTN